MFFIFSTLQLATMLNFLKHKILYSEQLVGTRHIAKPNFFKTGLAEAEILQFFNFLNRRHLHL